MLEAGGADSIDPIPIVRIYAGGRNGIQYRAISTSLSQLKRDFDCQGLGHNFPDEVKYNDDVRKLKWNPSDLVDWLLSGDIHIVCTHMHQGLPHWTVACGGTETFEGSQWFPHGEQPHMPSLFATQV